MDSYWTKTKPFDFVAFICNNNMNIRITFSGCHSNDPGIETLKKENIIKRIRHLEDSAVIVLIYDLCQKLDLKKP